MANSPQAIKRARQNDKTRALKQSQRRMLKTLYKNTIKLIADGALDQAKEAYKTLVSAFDRYANKGVLLRNKAANVKSRLNKRLKIASESA